MLVLRCSGGDGCERGGSEGGEEVGEERSLG